MTIQQIVETIIEKDWAFTVHQVKPIKKLLVKNVHRIKDPATYIMDLVKKNESEEIQILPVRMNGNAKHYGEDKTITINFNKNNQDNQNNMVNNEQLNTLSGLSGLGLNMAEIFTAKDKAEEVIDLKQKIQILESENKSLEKENTKLENKIEINEMKNGQRNELLEVIKSPQVMTLASALLSRGTTPALGAPASQSNKELDEKIQWLINFLEQEQTPEMTKDFMIYIAKAHQDENASNIVRELAAILMKHNIIQSKNTL